MPATTVRIGHLLDAEGRQFAQCNHGQFSPAENESHAAEIVHALNHRDKLVSALENMVKLLDNGFLAFNTSPGEVQKAGLEQARAALRDSKGDV